MKYDENKMTHMQGYDTKIGVLQWFHVGDYQRVEQLLSDLETLGITHLRTGISWADYHTLEGQKWYEWLIPKLGEHLEILPCFLYTPPSIGIAPKTSSPPKGPKKFADFIDTIIGRYGEYFEWVELWNEPNNTSEYDFTLDSNWDIFCEMITCAAFWCRHLGKKVVLGGMSPIDPNWLDYMAQRKVLENVDAVGIHGFPGTFDSDIPNWDEIILPLQKVLDYHGLSPEIWITEVGFSTWQHDEKQQIHAFLKVLKAPVERVYWYSLYDLAMDRPTVDGFHLDEREYFFGLKSSSGRPKLLYRLLDLHGLKQLPKVHWLKEEVRESRWKDSSPDHYIMITGGCGFVGINLADFFLKSGRKVLLYDNLSRPGVEKNLEWLLRIHPQENIHVEVADVRNYHRLAEAVKYAEAVFHFAAQVAVTTSLEDPAHDFEINAKGTFNVMEAVRNSSHQPPVIFTSTNKVYGCLPGLEFSHSTTRYYPVDLQIKQKGINEHQPLDFHSPYGSSKGSAEQYVLDYARSFGLKTVVFRMSCIYGVHQFGTEDQGWVAHFLINAIQDKPLTIYGDGMQVRDVLYITDLVKAFSLALQHIDQLSGHAFNIGGGIRNAISLKELITLVETLNEQKVPFTTADFRLGDQVYYVSDTSKFTRATGWKPTVSVQEGLEKLYHWLWTEYAPEQEINTLTSKAISHD